MGRIKTTLIKRVTHEMVKEYGDRLKPTFDENKKLVPRMVDVKSKKMRNIIAGYATRLTRSSK